MRDGEHEATSLRDDVLLSYRGRVIRPKTLGQKRYVDAIRSHTITSVSYTHLDAEDFDRLAGLFPGVSSRGDSYRVRLVQRDDDATAFEAEYLSQREAAAEDLMLSCRMTDVYKRQLPHC